MFELGGVTIGWREIIMALAGVVVLYMVLQLVLMHRVRPLPSAKSPVATVAPVEPGLAEAVATAYGAAKEDEPKPAPWAPSDRDFAQQAYMDGVERELDQLRQELDSLRTEVARLREELQGQTNLNRVTQTIAPIYGDAMKMALAGHDASVISERCGIARAEAELVEAMIRNQKARSA